MGDIADEARGEYEAELLWIDTIYRDALRQKKWICKDGSVMSIADMSNDHIQSCLRLLCTKDDEISLCYQGFFYSELEKRGV